MPLRPRHAARTEPRRAAPAPVRTTPVTPAAKEPLWRDVVGDVLRRERLAQERTLKDVAEAARISMPYLSEVERGRKEASSEVLAAGARALGLSLADLLSLAQTELTRSTQHTQHTQPTHRMRSTTPHQGDIRLAA
ncbi:helix-turn-helix domain-containing protein [Streptomyces sp. NPDC054855]